MSHIELQQQYFAHTHCGFKDPFGVSEGSFIGETRGMIYYHYHGVNFPGLVISLDPIDSIFAMLDPKRPGDSSAATMAKDALESHKVKDVWAITAERPFAHPEHLSALLRITDMLLVRNQLCTPTNHRPRIDSMGNVTRGTNYQHLNRKRMIGFGMNDQMHDIFYPLESIHDPE